MIPCKNCKHQYDKPNRCHYCKVMYSEFGKPSEYEPKTETPISFYVVEHEGQHNPITQSFTNIKDAEAYFNKNLEATPILYEVFPIQWVDRTGTKHETYN